MPLYDPYRKLDDTLKNVLLDAISEVYGEEFREETLFKVEYAPRHKRKAHLIIMTFPLARKLSERPEKVAKEISDHLQTRVNIFKDIKVEGPYINISFKDEYLITLLYESIGDLGEKYGFNPMPKSERIIVEYLSANPIHPIHIGGIRNAILGSTLANLLEMVGHKVRRHFYINDMGRQVAIAALGFKVLGEVKPWCKSDHVVGFIYAATSIILDILALKKKLEHYKIEGKFDDYRREITKLDSLIADLTHLKKKNPDVLNKLLDGLSKIKDPEREISKIIYGYEVKVPTIVKLVRKVCEMALEGFKETLSRAKIPFDSFDWESEITAWSGAVDNVIRNLSLTGYVYREKGALIFDVQKYASDMKLYERLNIPKSLELPKLTLTRADGTTLYTTRDIAYTLWKFKFADKVINVIGAEQRIPQIQLKVALAALGRLDIAKRLIHYSYEMVQIPGYRMSGRRGRYITFDELMDEAQRRALNEINKRSPHIPEDVKSKIAEVIGLSAIKYSMLSVSPSRPLVFRWEEALSFERNSGPFLQYTHVRAYNILEKAKRKGIKIDIASLKPTSKICLSDIELKIIFEELKFPTIIKTSANLMRPDILIDYISNLALLFNTFYEQKPVIKAREEERKVRLLIVRTLQIIFKNTLKIMGLEPLTRM